MSDTKIEQKLPEFHGWRYLAPGEKIDLGDKFISKNELLLGRAASWMYCGSTIRQVYGDSTMENVGLNSGYYAVIRESNTMTAPKIRAFKIADLVTIPGNSTSTYYTFEGYIEESGLCIISDSDGVISFRSETNLRKKTVLEIGEYNVIDGDGGIDVLTEDNDIEFSIPDATLIEVMKLAGIKSY